MALLPTGSVYSDTESLREFGQTIKLVKGDQGGELQLTLKDSNKAAEGATLDPENSDTWAPLDLTTANVVLKLRATGASEVKIAVPLYRIEPYTSGKVFLQWPAEALDTAGSFTGEVEITYQNGQVSTVYKELRFLVREDY
jgi:hypothetical protein